MYTNFDHTADHLLIYKQVHAYFGHCLNGNVKNYVHQMMACHPKIQLLTEIDKNAIRIFSFKVN